MPDRDIPPDMGFCKSCGLVFIKDVAKNTNHCSACNNELLLK